MKQRLRDIYHFFPIQLFLLHFRKFQILLFFWALLFAIVSSNFLKNFGADALFLSPEYLGRVNIFGSMITGVAFGVFVMSWNITTFILHTKRFRFLATSAQPFLKYCLNNALLPLIFIIFYTIEIFHFNEYRELLPVSQIIYLIGGLLIGIFFLAAISFAYFFTADKSIVKKIAPIVAQPDVFRKQYLEKEFKEDRFGVRVSYYLSRNFRPRKVRHTAHYSQQFIDSVFKRHHLAAIASIALAFFFLVLIGFFLDNPVFEIPAAASFMIFLAVMVAVIGALTYFLQSWSLVAIIILVVFLNYLYTNNIIDPRNKAYGLNYSGNLKPPPYDKASLQSLATPQQIEEDRKQMMSVLENWKTKQGVEKPPIVFINVSGGGLRSAAFVMNALQQLDSITRGQLMKNTFMISGASGGMLAASYYREIYRQHLKDTSFPLCSNDYINNISADLLNPIFSSMVSRDVFAPAQKFNVGNYSYIRDRGYAFEQKLSRNTKGLFDFRMMDIADDEKQAKIPLIFYNSVVKSDGRKLVISTLPVSYMMKPSYFNADTSYSPDAIDFAALFKDHDPMNLRILSALRMNATFPYVLPNVWLPSEPVIDVMDAGLRDYSGQETTLRFIDQFKDWIRENTGGVVLIQIRDRPDDNWLYANEPKVITDVVLGPATMLQENWFKLQDYFQADDLNYARPRDSFNFKRFAIVYNSMTPGKRAKLSFHLTARERGEVIQTLHDPANEASMRNIVEAIGP